MISRSEVQFPLGARYPIRPEGARLGNILIDEPIASTNYSVVYGGHFLGSDSRVAVKIYNRDYPRRRFDSEVAIHASLQHDNIVPFYKSGRRNAVQNGVPIPAQYIIMGRADQSARQLTDRVGGLAPVTAARIIDKTADALEFVHDAGYVHADVTPKNILLASGETVWLSDFGIASTSPKHDTRTTSFTTRYSAPEQWEGLAGPATDVYLLGLSSYALLTGETFFDVSHEIRWLLTQPFHFYPFFDEKIAQFAYPEFASLLYSSLEFNPRFRPTSAREFSQEFTRLANASTDSGIFGNLERPV